MKWRKDENGEIMIEGTLVMIVTMILLVWILALGFVYYQRYLVEAVTNDVAVKITSTYNNPDSDIIMGYVNSETFAERDLYRNTNNSELFSINQWKANEYVKRKLESTNFSGTVKNVKVTLKLVQDSTFRKHLEVKTQCTFNTPFGVALDFLGMDGTPTYEYVACEDASDIIDYISTVDFAHYQLSGKAVSSKITKFINSIVKLYNHKYAKN